MAGHAPSTAIGAPSTPSVSKAVPPADPKVANSRVPSSEVIGSGWTKPAHPAFAAFRDWTARYLAADAASQARLLAEGLALARERRDVLAALIRTDPEAALASAVPMVVRQQLPAAVVDLLERRVSALGDLSLNAVTPLPGQTVADPTYRSFLLDGTEYRAFVYGRRADQATVTSTSVVGISVDRSLAVSASPLRVLEAGEKAAGRAIDVVCPISGITSAAAADQPLNVAAPTAVEFNGRIQVLCHEAHVGQVEKLLLAAEEDHIQTAADSAPGSSGVSGRPTSGWTHGTKKVLIIRVDFSDLPGTPVQRNGGAQITPDVAVNLFNAAGGVGDFYAVGSYGQAALQITATVSGNSVDVTPVLRLPSTADTYAAANNNDGLHADARAAALAQGYDEANYDRVGVVFSKLDSLAGSQINYGGLGQIIGKYFWVNGEYDLRVVAHEIGHNFGLNHANLWQVSDGNPVSASGTSTEYGDPFDVMGSGGDSTTQFTHWNKSILQWIPDSAVTLASAAGTYRIYRFDPASAPNLANPRALKVVRDANTDYWIGYRRATANASLNGGAYVLWGYNVNKQANLLDLNTPGTDPTDAGLAIGTTFNDTTAGISLKPVAQGGSGTEEYLDVQVTFQPRIQWTQSTYVVDEQAGTVTLTLHRGQNSTGAVSVQWSTSPGTATTPADFTTSSGTVNWADGNSSDKTITIPIVPGASAGGTQNFTVNLGTITGGVVVGNVSTTVAIADPGVRDANFNADFMNSAAQKLLPLPDGSMVVGGWFSQVQDAGFNSYSRKGVTRLSASGVLDPTFASGGGTDATPVYDLALQPDGKIIAAGSFGNYNGTGRSNIARLNADGSLDSTFNPGSGADDIVYAVLLQPDGKIVIGGAFTHYNGTAREYLARLNADGSLDNSFVGPDFASTSGWWVQTLAMQADGKILVGGEFYFTGGATFKSGLCRVTTTGALDASFSGLAEGAHTAGNTSSLLPVYKVVVQPDGKILAGGNFTGFNNTTQGHLVRLTSTGAIDGSFTSATFDDAVNAIALLPDGKVVVGGKFANYGATASSRLAKLSSAGALDTGFSSAGGFGATVDDLELLPNGRVLLGGNFGQFQGSTNNRPVWQLVPGLGGLPGTVQFASATASGLEGANTVLSVTRTGGSLGTLTVGYATVPGTATTADFTTTTGVLTWADGDSAAKTISVPITADGLAESVETFTVDLGQPLIGGALLGATTQATVSIQVGGAITASTDFNGDGKSDLIWSNDATGERSLWLMNGTTFSSVVGLGTISSQWHIAATVDLNGDGKPDIVWQNMLTGERLVWLMNGATFSSSASLGVAPTDWKIVGAADMNGDGKPDLLWSNTSTGERLIWLMNGTTYSSGVSLGTVPTQWTLAATGDFNADGNTDLVWQNLVTGACSVWLMSGTAFSSSVSLGTVSTQWRIAGTGDYNGDGKPDIVWQNVATGQRIVWLMNGTGVNSTVSLGTVDVTWMIGRPPVPGIAADFNGDGKSDLLWQNTSTGDRSLWLMSGAAFSSSASLGNVPTQWSIAATGDFNGDGKPDILWQNSSTGERLLWLMNGSSFASSVSLGTVSTQWSIAGTGDFNGDGQTDILFQNTSTGARAIWLMNGSSFVSTVSLGTVATAWSIAGAADFNADGNPDILWQNASTGARSIWIMNGSQFVSSVSLGTVPVQWSIVGVGDYNGDGQPDILWQNTSTGDRLVWLMAGTTFQSSVSLGNVAVQWSIRN